MESKYKELVDKYERLLDEHIRLQQEYSENTIIQSMRDMKEQYQQLMESTVPIYRYTFINDKYKHIQRVCDAVLVILMLTRKECLTGENHEDLQHAVIRDISIVKDLLEDVLDRN